MRGRKPRARSLTAPTAAAPLPRCPAHLSEAARNEWRRLAGPLHASGILTTADRAALAAYCQAWARWVEAEERLKETPPLIRTPSGYVQQSPWLSIANKQIELMGRFMAELGLTPSARSRLGLDEPGRDGGARVNVIERFIVRWQDGEAAVDAPDGLPCDDAVRRSPED